MAVVNKDFLEPDAKELYKQLFLQTNDENFVCGEKPKCQSVIPKPGFCVKSKSSNGEKLFINFCRSENLPAPKDITDEELLKLLESEDPSGFRVPMSLGEPHAELDKSGRGCTVYDVVINSSFYESVVTREILMGFMMTVVLEGLETKYEITIDRNYRILKNRKLIGQLPEHNVRTQSKPWIMEVDSSITQTRPLISEVDATTTEPTKAKAPEPPYTMIQEPADAYPEYIVAEIHLPKVKMAVSLTLDIGEDRILLETRSNIYRLDIYLPYFLRQDECVAQFNRKTKILTITMPVQPPA